MTDQTVAVVLGLAVIAVVAVMLWRMITTRTSGSWNISVAKLFESKLKIGPDQQRDVEQTISEANQARGLPADAPTAPALPSTIRLRRILWVDDNPDNNLYETLALEMLGLAITKTTNSQAADVYLAAQAYALVITDLGRPNDTLAGLDFVRALTKKYSRLKVIIYTLRATDTADQGRQAGASAIVDTPHDLLEAVLAATA